METGKCHICGSIGELTKEHVPPRSAFNKQKALVYAGERLIQLLTSENFPWDFSDTQGKEVQGGVGYNTLCAKCNNDTGAWYGGAFAEFAFQGLEPVFKNKPGTIVSIKFKDIYPLRVLKQVVCMFLSINRPDFADQNPELRKFVLEREYNTLNNQYQIYGFGCRGKLARFFGKTVRADFSNGMHLLTFSEINAIPFGYVLEHSEQSTLTALTNLNPFSNYGYDDEISTELMMPIMEINSHLPLDFRSKEQIMKERHPSL